MVESGIYINGPLLTHNFINNREKLGDIISFISKNKGCFNLKKKSTLFNVVGGECGENRGNRQPAKDTQYIFGESQTLKHLVTTI